MLVEHPYIDAMALFDRAQLIAIGGYDNELSRFRVDVLLTLGVKEAVEAPAHWIDRTAADWREQVAASVGEPVGIRAIRDRRAAGACAAVQALQPGPSSATDLGGIRAAVDAAAGDDLEAVQQLARDLGVDLIWQPSGPAAYDAVLNPRWESVATETDLPRSAYRQYANARNVRQGARFEQTVRERLTRILPDHLVPSAIVTLDQLPLTTNGKLDRARLPAPDLSRQQAAYVSPRTPAEEILCWLFADVLGLEQVGVDDDFFALGGHSLTATRLASRIRATMGVDLTIRTIFDAPTVAALSTRLSTAGSTRRPLQRMERPDAIPLSFAQQRLWFLNRLEPQSATYNVVQALRLTGALDEVALEAALHDVVTRHETLRTIFPDSGGVPRQCILSPAEANVRLERIVAPAPRLAAALAGDASKGFDLSRDLPLRAHLYLVDAHRHVLLLVLHHIATDGWSMAPLARDLAHAYFARTRGEAPVWTDLPVQYADYAIWQRETLGSEQDADSELVRQLTYWRSALAGVPEQLTLPSDFPRPAVAGGRGARIPLQIDAATHAGLLSVARESRATLFIVVHGAVAALLTRLGAGTDVVVGTPIAGRVDRALDELVGFFVNTLVLRVDTSGHVRLADLITRARAAALQAYAHAEVPFERIVEALQPERSLARHPLFQIMLAVEAATTGRRSDAPALSGLEMRPEPVPLTVAKFDLSIALAEQRSADHRPAGLVGGFTYRTDLFTSGTMQATAARLERMLAAIAANATLRIGEVDLLSAVERQQVLEDWNATARTVPATTMPALVEASARQAPDAIAAIAADASLTFAALNARANQLSRLLIAAGVGPEHVVGVALERSIDLVVALLAVWKAGAAYLPLEPDLPAPRLAALMTDVAPRVVLGATSSPTSSPK